MLCRRGVYADLLYVYYDIINHHENPIYLQYREMKRKSMFIVSNKAKFNKATFIFGMFINDLL